MIYSGKCGKCEITFNSQYRHYVNRAICPFCDYFERLLKKL